MQNKHYNDHLEATEAWVVFSGQTDFQWLRFLKPGFRHCYVLLNDGTHWLSIDPLFPYTEIIVHHVNADFDLPSWLIERGYKVVPYNIRRDVRKPAPLMLFTCVEAVKRILGIHKWRVMTPWQLYKYLSLPNHQTQSPK